MTEKSNNSNNNRNKTNKRYRKNNNRSSNYRKGKNSKSGDNKKGFKKPHHSASGQKDTDQNQKHTSNNRNRRGRNNRRNRSNRKRNIPTREVFSAYLEQLSRYLTARSQYFQAHRGVMNKKVRKAYDIYERALSSLRSFEGKLKPWQKEEFSKRKNSFPEDNEFSTKHPEAEQAQEVSSETDNQAIFYHELISQKESNYSEDTEESSGTIEDYQKYKEQRLS